MIKVLMVGNDISVKGGITSVIKQLLNYKWKSKNISMHFIPTYIESSNFKKYIFFLISYIRIYFFIKKESPNILHIHMSYKGSFFRAYLIYLLCKKYKISVIVHLHGSKFKKWYDLCNNKTRLKIRKFLREVSAVIVLGDNWNKVIKKIEPNTRTLILSNTVKVSRKRVEWRSPFNIIYLGVLIKRKGIFDLLAAISKVKNDGFEKINCIIAGSGKEEKKLKERVSELNLEDCVTFTGWIAGENKKKLLLKSQMMILPSYNEGLPISILEAISVGMPVIATKVGDISSAVIDGKNGFLFVPGDVNKLTEDIETIIQNKKLYSKMVTYSKKIAVDNFSDSQYFTRICDLYKSVI